MSVVRMINHPPEFEPCRKCGAMAWVRVANLDRILPGNGVIRWTDDDLDDLIERWNCPCGNYLTWGHPRKMETA